MKRGRALLALLAPPAAGRCCSRSRCLARERPSPTTANARAQPLDASADGERAARSTRARLRCLYLPDGGDTVQFGAAPELLPGMPAPSSRCPARDGRRARTLLHRSLRSDARRSTAGPRLSPYYHPTRAQTAASFKDWSRSAQGARLAVPAPPDFQLSEDFEPRAESRRERDAQRLPERQPRRGRLSQRGQALVHARLSGCSPVAAKAATSTPTATTTKKAAATCSARPTPRKSCITTASTGHLDPRLNLVEGANGPLLRKTGATESCKSAVGQRRDLRHGRQSRRVGGRSRGRFPRWLLRAQHARRLRLEGQQPPARLLRLQPRNPLLPLRQLSSSRGALGGPRPVIRTNVGICR